MTRRRGNRAREEGVWLNVRIGVRIASARVLSLRVFYLASLQT